MIPKTHWKGTIGAPEGRMIILGYNTTCDGRKGDVFYWDEAVFLGLADGVDPRVPLTSLPTTLNKEAA